MTNLWQDMRYGARRLLKQPGFTLIAVITLALGIGANTAIFSVVNAVLLNPLPYHDPDRLVMVWEEAAFVGFARDTSAPANFADWQAQNQVFEGMAALDKRSFNLTRDGEPEKIAAYGVTANFFALLGVKPALGRDFLPVDDQPGAHQVAIISHQLWQNRYSAEPSIEGRDILLNGEKYTVIGVMPAGFQFLEREINLWVPIAFSPKDLANRGDHFLTVMARMKPNVTVAQANADIKHMMANIARAYPNETGGGKLSATVLPLRDQLAGELRRPLLVLLGAVGFVLLIACANIAGLLLARALQRRKEMAVRAALGAGRWALVRQLLTESLLLAVSGGALGVLLAVWSFAFLKQLIPPAMALSTELELSLPVLLFTLAASVLAGLIFGTVPALQASRADLNEVLKQGGGRAAAGVGQHRLRNLFVIGQVALALVLLAGAGLLMQTFYKLRQQYAGLNAEKVLRVRTMLSERKYSEHAKRTAFYDQVLEEVKHLPGVVSAGYTTAVPLAWKGGATSFTIEARQADADTSRIANHRQISADYLQTLGIALREGRYFDERDTLQSMPVVIINETTARRYWPNESAVGKRFKFGPADSRRPWMTIVGIAADVRQMGVDAPVMPEVYVPYRQANYYFSFAPRDLVIRTSGEPTSLVGAVRRAVQAADPEQPLAAVMTLDELLGEETVVRRLGMTLLATFAGLALLLAGLGIYGMLSSFVARRTPEIGVRLALGAQPRDILWLVLKKGMTLALLGVAIGLAGAAVLMQLMKSLLYEVNATDPLTFAVVALVLTLVALMACWIPARRATQVDPLVALRYE